MIEQHDFKDFLAQVLTRKRTEKEERLTEVIQVKITSKDRQLLNQKATEYQLAYNGQKKVNVPDLFRAMLLRYKQEVGAKE